MGEREAGPSPSLLYLPPHFVSNNLPSVEVPGLYPAHRGKIDESLLE